jgi:hypothetical protein
VLSIIVIFGLVLSTHIYLASGQLAFRKSGDSSIKQDLDPARSEAVDRMDEAEQKHNINKKNEAIQLGDILTQALPGGDIPFKLPSIIPFP